MLETCGTNLDAALESGEASVEQREFAECCRADSIDGETCGMIDPSFERGPCHDRPVCLDGRNAEWLAAPDLGKPPRYNL